MDQNVEVMVLGGKWIYDGCVSIDEMITRLELEKEDLKYKQAHGWTLKKTVDDDNAVLIRYGTADGICFAREIEGGIA